MAQELTDRSGGHTVAPVVSFTRYGWRGLEWGKLRTTDRTPPSAYAWRVQRARWSRKTSSVEMAKTWAGLAEQAELA